MREIYIGYLMEDSSPYNGNCNLQQIGFKPDPWRSSFHTDMCMKWQEVAPRTGGCHRRLVTGTVAVHMLLVVVIQPPC